MIRSVHARRITLMLATVALAVLLAGLTPSAAYAAGVWKTSGTANLSSVFFTDATHGWAVGGANLVYSATVSTSASRAASPASAATSNRTSRWPLITVVLLLLAAVAGLAMALRARRRKAGTVVSPTPGPAKRADQPSASQTSIEGSRYCAQCGSAVDADGAYCASCGAKTVR